MLLRRDEVNPDVRNTHQQTLLCYAAARDSVEDVEFLLAGDDVNPKILLLVRIPVGVVSLRDFQDDFRNCRRTRHITKSLLSHRNVTQKCFHISCEIFNFN